MLTRIITPMKINMKLNEKIPNIPKDRNEQISSYSAWSNSLSNKVLKSLSTLLAGSSPSSCPFIRLKTDYQNERSNMTNITNNIL